MKDYIVELKLKNNYLFKTINKQGFTCVPELSRASGIGKAQLYRIANLKESAYDSKTNMRPYVAKVIDFLKCGVEDIYPPGNILMPLEQNVFVAEVSTTELIGLTSSSEPLAELEKLRSGDAVMETLKSQLTDREHDVMHSHVIDGATFDSLGEKYGITAGRTSQIYKRALRKIRNKISRTPDLGIEHDG